MIGLFIGLVIGFAFGHRRAMQTAAREAEQPRAAAPVPAEPPRIVVHDVGTPRADGTQRCLRCGEVLADNGPTVALIGDAAPHWWPAGPVWQADSFFAAGDHPDAVECRA